MAKKFSFLDKARLIERDSSGRPIKAEIDIGKEELKSATITIGPPASKSFLLTVYVSTQYYDRRLQLRTDSVPVGRRTKDRMEMKISEIFGKFGRTLKLKQQFGIIKKKSFYEVKKEQEMNFIKSIVYAFLAVYWPNVMKQRKSKKVNQKKPDNSGQMSFDF